MPNEFFQPFGNVFGVTEKPIHHEVFYFLFRCFGVFLFVTASNIGGLQIEEYNFTGQYISESFSEGLPNVVLLRYMYIFSGFLLLLFGFMALQALKLSKIAKSGFYLFGIFYGLGTVTVLCFHATLVVRLP